MAIMVTPKLANLPDVTTTTPSDGQVLTYDTASGKWINEDAASGGVTDHGALTGLGDDDHTQYLLKAGGTMTGALSIGINNAVTNAVTTIGTLTHNSTGTPAAGFGAGILFQLETTTTADTTAAQIAASWSDATHATRTSQLGFSTVLNGSTVTPLTITSKKVTFTTANTITSGFASGVDFVSTMTPAANGTGNYRGASFTLSSGNTNEIATATGFLAYLNPNSYMATLNGIEVQALYGANANIPNSTLMLLTQNAKTSGASVTNKYGLRITDMTHGTNNWAIYTGAGKVRLGDVVNFAGTMGDSTKTVGTDAPADWVQIEIGGTTYYLPAYAA